jgi:uncharacterized membrane protein (GlpM family)
MLPLFLNEAPELVVRAATTAIFVVLVGLAVVRLGPTVGGVIAGLPIILGPGFYFLARCEPAAFVADAAAYALISLTATQVFLTVYLLLAKRVSSSASLGLSVAVWLAAAVPLRLLPPLPLLGIVLFTVVTIACRKLTDQYRNDQPPSANNLNLGSVLLRATLGGVLVASITAGAAQLSPSWSGLFLAFPVGFSVVAVTVHRQHGETVLAATLHSALGGALSLAAFCATLAVAVQRLSPDAGLLTALAASLAATAYLLRSRANAGVRHS